MAEKIKRIKDEIIGVVSVMGGLYLLLSLITHYVRDSVLFFRITEPQEPIRNFGGIFGAHISGLLIIFLGFSAYIIPLLLFFFGIRSWKKI